MNYTNISGNAKQHTIHTSLQLTLNTSKTLFLISLL